MTSISTLENKWKESTERDELQNLKDIYGSLFRNPVNPADQFDMESVNKKGNTILHCLTKSVGILPEEKEYCLKMFDAFLSISGEWWKRDFPFEDDAYAKYRAVKHLTLRLRDKSRVSVLELAFKCGAVEIIQRLMLLENVNVCVREGRRRYDITHMTPKTSDQDIFRCKAGRQPCLNLLRNSHRGRAVEVLDIEPLKEIEVFYNSVTSKVYFSMAVVHILYMTLFSYTCCTLLMDKNANETTESNSTLTTTEMLLYFVVPVEPGLLVLYVLFNLYSMASWKRFYFDLVRIILTLFYIIIVSVSVYLYYIDHLKMYYTMSLSLLFGWLVTFSFTRGIRSINFFLKVIYQIILADVLKVLFVYLFFLLSFSFAMHVQFLASSKILEFYKTPAHTMFLMFNVMMGMGDQLLDTDIESGLEEAGMATVYSKVLYTVYVIIAPIVLLNLLIAMMNTSYSNILDEHAHIWRIDSILLGVAFEQNVPCLARLCGRGTIHYGRMFSDSDPLSKFVKHKVWFIEVKIKSEQSESAAELEGAEDAREINILSEKIQTMEMKLDKIENLLKVIVEKLPDRNRV